MNDPQHSQDLRRMRAKSKSWSGGTVSRWASWISGYSFYTGILDMTYWLKFNLYSQLLSEHTL